MSAGTIALKRIAEDTGTSVAMIEKHYGKYMPSAGDAERLDAALGMPPRGGTTAPRCREDDAKGPRHGDEMGTIAR